MYKNSERIMAWVAKIDKVEKHPDADALDICTVGGWKCVTKINEFIEGDLAVYVSIDSWIPTELAPFLSKGQEPREYNGVKGERLRTVKLRGQVSQGLLLKTEEYTYSPDSCLLPFVVVEEDGNDGYPLVRLGDDVTELLNIQKWEAPIPAQLQGEVRGSFPGLIPKTDQERVQNLSRELAGWADRELTFELTEKLDGSSMTVYVNGADQGVCSRNLSLKETENNSFWSVCRREQLIDKLRKAGLNLALQGELIGEGIQGNPYKIKGQAFYLYDIYNINEGCYFSPVDRRAFAEEYDILHVPVLADEESLGVGDVQSVLSLAEGRSQLHQPAQREGLVFKCNEDPSIHFKAISNQFLLREKIS